MSKSIKFTLPRTYEVGFAKPPEKSRFKPGISGNPKGRLEGTKNRVPVHTFELLERTILQEAYRKISVLEGGKARKITMMQTIIRSLATSAAKGNIRAAKQFANMVNIIEAQEATKHWEFMRNAVQYKKESNDELARRKNLGLTGPEFLPHPDHVRIDRETGDVWLTGPATKEQDEKFRALLRKKEGSDEDIREFEKMRSAKGNKKIHKLIENEIDYERKRNETIQNALHDVIYNYPNG